MKTTESTDAENVINSTSAESASEEETLPLLLAGSPELITALQQRGDELSLVAAERIGWLLEGNRQSWEHRNKSITAQVDFARLKWMVTVAVGRSSVAKTGRPLELLNAWLDQYSGKKIDIEEFYEGYSKEEIPVQQFRFACLGEKI